MNGPNTDQPIAVRRRLLSAQTEERVQADIREAVARYGTEHGERAFARVIRTIYDVVFLKAYHMLRDEDAAKDVLQTGTLKAFTRLDTFDPERAFLPWFLRIVRRTAIDYSRQRRGRGKRPRPMVERYDPELHSHVAARVEDHDFRIDYAAWLERLPEPQGRFWAALVERGLPVAAAAHLVGQSGRWGYKWRKILWDEVRNLL